jgi:general secretion pathway protein H
MAKLQLHKATATPSALGFTLIEIMLVIALIGVIATMVQFSASSGQPSDKLKHESERFAAIFTLATDYGMLNNVELGLLVEPEQYRILAYDGVSWTELAEQEIFETVVLPEGMLMTLELDDLPIEQPLLFDSRALLAQQQEQQEQQERSIDTNATNTSSKQDSGKQPQKPLIPQVYILSGGDITPFSLSFQFADVFTPELAKRYKVTGIYGPPLTIEGPLDVL